MASTGGCGATVATARMRLLAGGERVAGLRGSSLPKRDGLAGLRRTALLAVLPDQLEHAGDAAGLAAPA